MSDYLGHLIERTLSPRPEVKPQLPSIFEPACPASLPDGAFEASQENRCEPPQRPRSAKLKEEAQEISPPADHDVESHVSAPRVHRPKISRPAEIISESVTESRINPGSPAPPSRQKASVPLPTQSGLVERPQPIAQHDARTDAGSKPDMASDKKETVSIRAVARPPAILRPERSGADAQASAAIRPAVISPRPPPSISKPVALKSEPTIQVTIGRLEVRAVSAPARPGIQARVARGLQLEDYLRQRANGGRE